MIAKIYSAIPQGYTGHLVTIEGDANKGLPAFNIVGMAAKTITEARERVRSALANSGFMFPRRKVTISLAPAELAKDGSHLDLPIALAILVLSQQLLPEDVVDRLFVGELSLDGLTKPVRGIINIVETAKNAGYREIYVPEANYQQASLVSGIKIIGVNNLDDLYLHLKGQFKISPPKSVVENTETDNQPLGGPFLDDIYGQELAKRALIIALAGHHNLLLNGPPGSGKTMLARVAANLLPPASPTEQIEITKIHSLVGATDQIMSSRPFRAPHHTASPTAMIGGGLHLAPGEISLAHRGILFLDEFPEYARNVIESLRQPLEDGVITLTRTHGRAVYPADFMLIATMNPCPCGHLGDPFHQCTCSPPQISNYRRRVSGPILDRIDLVLNVKGVEPAHLVTSASPSGQKNVVKNNHTEAKQVIAQALIRQAIRYGQDGKYNSSLSSAETTQYIHLQPAARKLLRTASTSFRLSARSYFKIIKVAQTIADLDGSDSVQPEHISEALSLRHRTDQP